MPTQMPRESPQMKQTQASTETVNRPTAAGKKREPVDKPGSSIDVSEDGEVGRYAYVVEPVAKLLDEMVGLKRSEKEIDVPLVPGRD